MKITTWRNAAFFIAIFTTFAPMAATAATISSPVLLTSAGTPLYLYIPSIKLLSPVQGVGVNERGNMDVPGEYTNNVGWYERGVTPGNVGTAVIDAHNTAAFKKLDQVSVGAEIYVYTSAGEWLHFVTTNAQTYSMDTLSPATLFAPANAPQINLITCAGLSLGNGEATHRLIVSARLAA